MSVYTTSTKTKMIPFSDRFSRNGRLVAPAGENEGRTIHEHLASLFFFSSYFLSTCILTRLFLAHVLSIPSVPTGVYPLQLLALSRIQPCVPRVFQISRLALQYDMLIPLRGNFANLRVTNFSAVIPFCCFFFLFCYLWVLLFWCFCNDTTCPLIEIHDVTWAIRLIGAL